MKIGLALDFGSLGSVVEQLDAAMPVLRTAEEAGLSGLWVGESYHSRPEAFHLPAALIMLAHLAARTTLGLGTGVLLLRAYDPARLGYETALLDQLSPGRLSVGIGLGPAELDERFGTGTASGAERMETAIREMCRAWGRDGAAPGVVPSPTSPRGPRILVGGGAPASVRRAADLGDGYFAATNYSDRLLERQVRSYRRRAPSGDAVVNRICVIHPDPSTAREQAERHFGPVFDYYTRRRLWRSIEDDRSPEPPVLAGSPADFARALDRYAEMGVTEVNLRVSPHGMPSDIARRTVELAATRLAAL